MMTETSTIIDAYRHCEDLVRRYDKDHYLTGLFAPAQRRKFLYALYAFALEIAQVKSRVREPVAGAIRLQWWHEAVSGVRAEEAAANPVMHALIDAAQQTGTSLAPLTAAIEAREAELRGERMVVADPSIFVVAAQFLGAQDDAVASAAAAAAGALASMPVEPQKARAAYQRFRILAGTLPKQALPAFLIMSLVPVWLKHLRASQWRRQVALLRAAWFGFPNV